MNSYEAVAKTPDEAIELALEALGTTIDEVSIDIFEQNSKGLFGFLKASEYRVVATKKNPETEDKVAVFSEEPSEIKSKLTENKAVCLNSEKINDSDGELFLSNMLSYMNVKANIETSINENGLLMNISGENMGIVIGKRGQTLDALQYLVSLVVNKGSNEYTRVILDTENYREKRKESLVALADKIATKAVKYRKTMTLEPMNPYERRIIHASLQDHPKVSTRSEGREPYRKVVIYLKK